MVDAVSTVWAKKEGVYGTDAVPTGAANGILTRNFSMKPVEMDRLDRNLDQLIYGAQSSGTSNKRMTMAYEVELAGSGAAGTAPRWMELLEGCGLDVPVLSAGVDAQQDFALAGTPASSLTQYGYWQDQLRKMVGSAGTFSLDFTAGAYPFLGFNWTGLLAATPFSKSAPGETDLSDWVQPVEVNTDNTSFTLDGYAPALRSLKLDANVATSIRNLVGKRYVRRGNHAMSGTMIVEATDIATKDYLSTLLSGTTVPWSLEHGTVAGNIIGIGGAKAQITDISESKEDDVLMWTISVTCTVDGGVPDISFSAE